MESALIVSSTEKSLALLREMLSAASFRDIATVKTGGEARRLLLERDYDLVVINAPLRDESGESLSRQIASQGVSQVILVVKAEFFEEVSAETEEYGVLTVAKPINKTLFWYALKLARSAGSRLKNIQAENTSLKQKIEDIRVIDRAKCILISYLRMSEPEAHRYLEKQAMDLRVPKREVAERILKMYE
ncbi:MAG: ANTAR domain-containing protein [Firmicutes bacterium]|nr:ANTAR domain-containing protein [Bacillota bacterium]